MQRKRLEEAYGHVSDAVTKTRSIVVKAAELKKRLGKDEDMAA